MFLLVTTKNEFSFNNLIEYRNGTFSDYRKHFCQHVVIVLNYFCHEFETVSCTYPYFKIASFSPYRINHLNELIQISPSFLRIYMAVPFHETQGFHHKFKNTFYTLNLIKLFMNVEWRSKWCWKTLTEKIFLFFTFRDFVFSISIVNLKVQKCNRLHV